MTQPKPPNMRGEPWTAAQDEQLGKLAKQDTPTSLIAWHLGRTRAAVYRRASTLGVSLEPPNPAISASEVNHEILGK